LTDRRAFTLIELIVVLSLVSILMFFAVPRIDPSFFSTDSRKLSSWLQINTKALKNRAVAEQAVYALYVGLDENRLWTGPASDRENIPDPADGDAFAPDSGSRITDVMFPQDTRISSGTARILFYPKGYSDRAIIHVQTGNQTRKSYRIESFLPQIAIRDAYVEF